MDEMIILVIEMLRSYNLEPQCDAEKKMANVLFSEMLMKAKSKAERKEMQDLFNKTR